jgi:hypothetical protein
MTLNGGQDDRLATMVARLRTYDVSQRQTDRLRSRYHGLLQARTGTNGPAEILTGSPFRRVIGPALGGAWCLAYLVEIIRRAAAGFGL